MKWYNRHSMKNITEFVFNNEKLDCSKNNPAFSLMVGSLYELASTVTFIIESGDFDAAKVVLDSGVKRHLPKMSDYSGPDTSIPRVVCEGEMAELFIGAYQKFIDLASAVEHEEDLAFGSEEKSDLLKPDVFSQWLDEAVSKLLILQKKLTD